MKEKTLHPDPEHFAMAVDSGRVMPQSDYVQHAQGRRQVVCLCGSTQFYATYKEAYLRESLRGSVVLTVTFPDNAETATATHHTDTGYITPAQKKQLDRLHFQKIEMADEILVLNVNGYIGMSTLREIVFAQMLGKAIRFWDVRKGGAFMSLIEEPLEELLKKAAQEISDACAV